MTWLLILLFPPVGFLLHTLAGLLFFLPIYGIESITVSDWAIEVVAKRTINRKGKEVTRIWGRPGAQTHGCVIFYASEEHRQRADLRVHERVHIIQGFCLGLVYIVTYGLHFAFNYLVLANFFWRREEAPRWKRAYFRIIWEVWAYAKQAKFNAGKIQNAWGA